MLQEKKDQPLWKKIKWVFHYFIKQVLKKLANLELEVLQGETSDILDTHGRESVEEGYDYNEEYDNEDDTYGDEGLDDEQEMIFNE